MNAVSFDREDIFKVVLAAADDLNATHTEEDRFEPAETTLLIGDGGRLSSLAIITLILGVEERLSEALSRPVSLFDESLIAQPDGPFRTVGSFVDHIQAVVRDSAP
jgi:acyl carrier protein